MFNKELKRKVKVQEREIHNLKSTLLRIRCDINSLCTHPKLYGEGGLGQETKRYRCTVCGELFGEEEVEPFTRVVNITEIRPKPGNKSVENNLCM